MLSKQEALEEWASDKKKERKPLVIAICVAGLVFFACMSVRYAAYGYDDKFVPLEYIKSFALFIKLGFLRLTGAISEAGAEAQIEAFGSSLYLGFFARFQICAMSFVAGAALAVSGAIFQTAYQNPMASPNTIGATAGVGLGNILVVSIYGVSAIGDIFLRYRYCYLLTAACVFAVLLLGRLCGGKRNFSVMEMVMAGSVVSQVIQVFSMYFMYNLDSETLVLYQQLSLGTYLDTSLSGTIMFFSVMAVSLLPVVLIRFRLNALALSWEQARVLGINAGPLRIIAQIFGALMVTCAMIHFGEIGMISMAVPYIVRQTAGADFRKILIYSVLLSGSLVMAAKTAADLFRVMGEALPIAFLINLVVMPLFLLVIARSAKSAKSEDPGRGV